jgi:hypothetical protein
MYAFNSHIVSKATETIVDNMDDKFEDIDDKFSEIDTKLQSIEDLINIRLEVCYKKVNDIYSLQHKVNEITKMNNQSIIHQINQYDEEIEDVDVNRHNTIYNSQETSMSPQSKINNLNNKCFIKHTSAKNQDREMFYMSSMNKNEINSREKTKTKPSENSETSTEPEAIKENIKYKDLSSTLSSHQKNKNDKSSNSKSSEKMANNKTTNNLSNDDNIFSNLYKNNKKTNLKIVKDNISVDNESNLEQFINSLPEKIVDNFFQKNKKNIDNNDTSSIILEMNSDVVKPCEVETSSPKFANAMKILNETNVIKNNSYNKLNELSKKTQNISNINNNFDSNNNKNDDNNINNTKYNKEPDSETESDSESESNSENNTSNSSLNNEEQFDNFADLGGNSFVFADFTKKSAKQNKVVELN